MEVWKPTKFRGSYKLLLRLSVNGAETILVMSRKGLERWNRIWSEPNLDNERSSGIKV